MIYVGGQKVSNICCRFFYEYHSSFFATYSVNANLNENVQSSCVSFAIEKFVNPEIPKVRTVRVR